jgi:hypothetical protein
MIQIRVGLLPTSGSHHRQAKESQSIRPLGRTWQKLGELLVPEGGGGSVKVVCAYCAAEGKPALMGEKEPLDDPGETHGICAEHQRCLAWTIEEFFQQSPPCVRKPASPDIAGKPIGPFPREGNDSVGTKAGAPLPLCRNRLSTCAEGNGPGCFPRISPIPRACGPTSPQHSYLATWTWKPPFGRCRPSFRSMRSACWTGIALSWTTPRQTEALLGIPSCADCPYWLLPGVG